MGPTQATESSIWHVPRMRNRAKSSALAADTPRRHRAPISDSPSLSIRSRGARKGSKWASERAARVDSGVVMGWDQGADGAGSARGLYQDPLRAQGAWFEGHEQAKRQRGDLVSLRFHPWLTDSLNRFWTKQHLSNPRGSLSFPCTLSVLNLEKWRKMERDGR